MHSHEKSRESFPLPQAHELSLSRIAHRRIQRIYHPCPGLFQHSHHVLQPQSLPPTSEILQWQSDVRMIESATALYEETQLDTPSSSRAN